MKVYLIKRLSDNKYYCKQGCWLAKLINDSYMTKQAANWHRTFWLNDYNVRWKIGDKPEDIIVEEYEMVKVD